MEWLEILLDHQTMQENKSAIRKYLEIFVLGTHSEGFFENHVEQYKHIS